MQDSVAQVREVARAIGLDLPDDRLPAIASAIRAAQQQVERIRTIPTSVPGPTVFDASWSPKK